MARMFQQLVLFIGLFALAIGSTRAAESLAVATRPGAPAAETFARVEFTVDPARIYDNPFDPDEIALDAEFSGPAGATLTVPAFWFQECRWQRDASRRDTYLPEGPGQWLIRFAPPAPGNWQVTVTARDRTDTRRSKPLPFTVNPSNRSGFVRRAPNNPRYFQTDSGAPFFPVGLNLAWPAQSGLLGNGTRRSYEAWFPKLAAAGGNFARVWMAWPNVLIETKQLGPGRFDPAGCYFYDWTLDLAERHSVRCMLTLFAHSELLSNGKLGKGHWADHPYNSAHGGPATQPADFFSDPRARKLVENRLRYLIARYSAYTALAAWELFNEQDLCPVPDTREWTRFAAAYLKAHDPYRHLVTTSFSRPAGQPEIWNLPEIDWVQSHRYGDPDRPVDLLYAHVADVRSADVYHKPYSIGEFGICWKGSDSTFDKANLATNLHNTLWASTLAGSSGAASVWWWDKYIAPGDLWSTFTGLAKFTAAVDWPRRRFAPLEVPAPALPAPANTRVDLVLPVRDAWEKAPAEPLVIEPEGWNQPSVPCYYYGPAKPDLAGKVQLKIDLQAPSTLVLHVAKVSDSAALRVSIDGKPAADFSWSAQPGAPGQESTRKQKDVWQAVINKDVTVDVPAGPHALTLDVLSGDWVSLSSLTFRKASTGLRTLALSDSASGEVLLWLQDAASNYLNDQAGLPPRRLAGVTLRLPVPKDGAYDVDWWDTRHGTILRTDRLAAAAGHLTLAAPAFERDLALRAHPAAAPSPAP